METHESDLPISNENEKNDDYFGNDDENESMSNTRLLIYALSAACITAFLIVIICLIKQCCSSKKQLKVHQLPNVIKSSTWSRKASRTNLATTPRIRNEYSVSSSNSINHIGRMDPTGKTVIDVDLDNPNSDEEDERLSVCIADPAQNIGSNFKRVRRKNDGPKRVR
ncbi:hypothetical protein RDWZM_007891 [Blomia tropicalis]|uniref:Uncharacterized protein n=1 Tax=Blomia tropicalis TaxID=40697 RepID=A0A9Q0M0B8_BLOTA|nr:hypothetical protein BLOT_003516 [Blomia tropicalis]KAJ6216734.1 hypothetical protein RDWZM_007891 [Blomia tropicalis]